MKIEETNVKSEEPALARSAARHLGGGGSRAEAREAEDQHAPENGQRERQERPP